MSSPAIKFASYEEQIYDLESKMNCDIRREGLLKMPELLRDSNKVLQLTRFINDDSADESLVGDSLLNGGEIMGIIHILSSKTDIIAKKSSTIIGNLIAVNHENLELGDLSRINVKLFEYYKTISSSSSPNEFESFNILNSLVKQMIASGEYDPSKNKKSGFADKFKQSIREVPLEEESSPMVGPMPPSLYAEVAEIEHLACAKDDEAEKPVALLSPRAPAIPKSSGSIVRGGRRLVAKESLTKE